MTEGATYVEEREVFRRDPVTIENNPAAKPNTMGYFWLVYGIVRLVGAVALILYSSTATLMFGALLSRVPDPVALMNLFRFFYLCAVGLAAAAGLFSIVAGWSLISGAASRRMLVIVAALLSVSDIPFGTTLGAYTLAVFSPRL
jgi:hypothetical protein